MVCHSLLQWNTFCQISPPWPTHPEWAHRAWLSFIELEKAVVCVIRLTSFLWLWFQCICPLMPSRNTYHLTWVSLTLGMGCLFMAAPAKHSHCSLPWTRGIIYDLYYDEEFVIYDLYYVEVGSLSIHFLEGFIINGYWILSKNFFCIYWDDHMVLSFNLLIWCITLINLHILKNLCILGLNPIWSWCMIVLMYY